MRALRGQAIAGGTFLLLAAVGAAEHLSGVPAATLAATEIILRTGLLAWVLAAVGCWFAASFHPVFRVPCYILTVVFVFAALGLLGLFAKIPFLAMLAGAWAVPHVAAALSMSSGSGRPAVWAFATGAAAQWALAAVMLALGAPAWAVLALLAYGTMSVSAATYAVHWTEEQELLMGSDSFGDFYFATFGFLAGSAVAVVVLLPVIAMWSGGDED